MSDLQKRLDAWMFDRFGYLVTWENSGIEVFVEDDRISLCDTSEAGSGYAAPVLEHLEGTSEHHDPFVLLWEAIAAHPWNLDDPAPRCDCWSEEDDR